MRLGWWITAALLALMMACGPMSAMGGIRDAEEAVEVADAAEAAKFAPYPYWLAVHYLNKAKRTEGYAEYEASRGFADKAKAFAEQSVIDAKEAALRQQRLDQRLRERAQ